ncbi:stage III sporulation protein AB [Clostridium minihomine]|uniref:stage III sporulation protein AB n=1 Tax=Clostridium minihomine TaxID=2045012 RepID=UPI001FB1E6AF|nr:stage III sporulation protein AB [Clostridium minihomine]
MESHKLGRRVKELEAFFSFLSSARAEIRYSAMPVERIVEKHGKNQKFLALCSQYCRQGETFPQAWEHGIQDGMTATGLKAQDLDYIRDFGRGFGMTDLEGQLAHCQLYLGFISNALTEAREEKEKKARLYCMLGLFGGIAAALVLS